MFTLVAKGHGRTGVLARLDISEMFISPIILLVVFFSFLFFFFKKRFVSALHI